MRTTNIFAAISSMLLAAGCAIPPREGVYSSNTSPHGSETMAMSAQNAADRSMEDSIRYQLNRFGDLAATTPNIQITARSGAVTLTGAVPGEKEKEMIEACVRNTTGVLTVDNQLALSYPTPTGTYPQSSVYVTPAPTTTLITPEPTSVETLGIQVQATTDTDRAIAQQVIDTVRRDPVWPTLAPTVNISVTDGRAFIQGTVDSRNQRRAIIDAVKRVPGVIDVREDLRIR